MTPTKRDLNQLLAEWNGIARHQTITFGGAAELVRTALRDQSDVRRAAADMTDDELAEALNEWHLRKSEQGDDSTHVAGRLYSPTVWGEASTRTTT
jgi:hypothetical protein